MTWTVEFFDDFEKEFQTLKPEVQDALFAVAKLLSDYGPHLGRPHVDTLKGSKFANMKELRFEAMEGEWRAFFAFDPTRRAIVLVAGDKSGVSERAFYKRTLAKAERRFAAHLAGLKDAKERR